jgi:hypothetical protein
VHAALDPEQVRELDLPSPLLKEGEKRAAKWLELYGSEQTPTPALPSASGQPTSTGRSAPTPRSPAEIDEDRLATLKARAEAALANLREVDAEPNDMADEVEISDPPALPEPDRDALEEAQAERRDAVLIDSDMDYVEGRDRLREHSEMAARRR